MAERVYDRSAPLRIGDVIDQSPNGLECHVKWRDTDEQEWRDVDSLGYVPPWVTDEALDNESKGRSS